MIDQEIAWSHADISRQLVALGCLPTPPDDAPIDELYKCIVADFFMVFCRSAGDSATMHARAIDAANFILSNFSERREQMRPHIERALGRALTDDEVGVGKLSEEAPAEPILGCCVPKHDPFLAEVADLY